MSEPQPTAPPVPGEPPDAAASDFDCLRHARPREPVLTPNGKRAWVVGMTQQEKHDWQRWCLKKTGPDGSERFDDPLGDAKLVIRSLRNSAGQRLFPDEAIMTVSEWPPLVLAEIVEKCCKVSAIGGRADAEILKNFMTTLSAGS